jgi:two-component system cell cycle response regulator DivK
MHVVLLVEDSADLRQLYAAALRESGLIVDEVESIREALVRASQLPPDLVLLDRRLPDGDGWTVARSLKANEATRHVPITAFTTHRERADVEGALVAGCDAFLEKGCLPEALVRHVRGMLGLPLDTTDEHAVLITTRTRRVSALS